MIVGDLNCDIADSQSPLENVYMEASQPSW